MATISGAAILAELEKQNTINFKNDYLQYDLGLLCAFDDHPLDPTEFQSKKEETLLKATKDNTQLLVKHIFELPIEMHPFGPVAKLPPPETRLPRSKPVPKPKPLTRWQKFALEKGITKKKKSMFKYDEETNTERRIHGKDSIGKSTDWVRPFHDTDPEPWKKESLERAERKVSNKLAQVKNIERNSGSKKSSDPSEAYHRNQIMIGSTEARTASSASNAIIAPKVMTNNRKRKHEEDGENVGVETNKKKKNGSKANLKKIMSPVAGIAPIGAGEGSTGQVFDNGKKARKLVREPKEVKAAKIRTTQLSTASMGQFDKMRKGEPERPKLPNKVKRVPNEVAHSAEVSRQKELLRQILG
jgi:regulator of ribosome biosynthesis